MKIISLFLILYITSFAGSHGSYVLSCTSASLRTHMNLTLNDYDFVDTALYPQEIVISVMGNMDILDAQSGINQFKTVDNHNILDIYNSDKSYHFIVDFRKDKSANITVKKAMNPRTDKDISGLKLTCTKYHDL
jgi:hypothetical protein